MSVTEEADAGYANELEILLLETTKKDDSLRYQRILEASSNVAGPSLRNMMQSSTFVDRKLSSYHSEPNIATTFWRRSRRRVIIEQRTANSSPEHPSSRARGRSMLSGDQKSFRDFTDDIGTSSLAPDQKGLQPQKHVE